MEALRAHDATLTKSLLKQKHIEYMKHTLDFMGKSIIHFDYGQPWIYFYILNTLSMCKSELT